MEAVNAILEIWDNCIPNDIPDEELPSTVSKQALFEQLSSTMGQMFKQAEIEAVLKQVQSASKFQESDLSQLSFLEFWKTLEHYLSSLELMKVDDEDEDEEDRDFVRSLRFFRDEVLVVDCMPDGQVSLENIIEIVTRVKLQSNDKDYWQNIVEVIQEGGANLFILEISDALQEWADDYINPPEDDEQLTNRSGKETARALRRLTRGFTGPVSARTRPSIAAKKSANASFALETTDEEVDALKSQLAESHLHLAHVQSNMISCLSFDKLDMCISVLEKTISGSVIRASDYFIIQYQKDLLVSIILFTKELVGAFETCVNPPPEVNINSLLTEVKNNLEQSLRLHQKELGVLIVSSIVVESHEFNEDIETFNNVSLDWGFEINKRNDTIEVLKEQLQKSNKLNISLNRLTDELQYTENENAKLHSKLRQFRLVAGNEVKLRNDLKRLQNHERQQKAELTEKDREFRMISLQMEKLENTDTLKKHLLIVVDEKSELEKKFNRPRKECNPNAPNTHPIKSPNDKYMDLSRERRHSRHKRRQESSTKPFGMGTFMKTIFSPCAKMAGMMDERTPLQTTAQLTAKYDSRPTIPKDETPLERKERKRHEYMQRRMRGMQPPAKGPEHCRTQ
eukprot:GHVL01018180.1.p1 GENE.GHVL01018180.1~~GHVL01018180.1.p1  ORF type:complete len:625 (-),score=108.94 GHVL01018180.1:4470-6344(-)